MISPQVHIFVFGNGRDYFRTQSIAAAALVGSYVLRQVIQRIQRVHFILAGARAIDDHPFVQAKYRPASGARMDPGKGAVDEARECTAEHGPAESQRVPGVFTVGLTDGCRMLMKSSE
jgi:hypothetical protein